MTKENTMTIYGFPKKEHLCGKKNIETLFEKGDAFLLYPFRIVWLEVDSTLPPIRTMVGISKKRCKLAVKRNKIKRQMRESYRTNKKILFDAVASSPKSLHVSIQYIANEEKTFDFIADRMEKTLQKLAKTYREKC